MNQRTATPAGTGQIANHADEQRGRTRLETQRSDRKSRRRAACKDQPTRLRAPAPPTRANPRPTHVLLESTSSTAEGSSRGVWGGRGSVVEGGRGVNRWPLRTVGLVGGKRRRQELGSGKPKYRAVGGRRSDRKERRRAAREAARGRVRLERCSSSENLTGRTRVASPNKRRKDADEPAEEVERADVSQVVCVTEGCAFPGWRSVHPRLHFRQAWPPRRAPQGARCGFDVVRPARGYSFPHSGLLRRPPAGTPLCRTCQGRQARGCAA